MSAQLYFYQCGNDGTTAVAQYKAQRGQPYLCVLCHRWMKFLYPMAIETAQHRQWASRGIVYNPGVGQDPAEGSLREIPKASGE